ncbi:MAG: PEP-CTERM sorting domain-containing protein [Phycisphaerae bacterium]|nr:PEP-CTERM sorting domain-containing protein [Gemmatimonadaceae bacterium]
MGGQVGATALIGNGQVHTWKAKADLATRDAQNGSALMANQSVVAFANSIITDAVTPKSSNVQATTVAFHFAIDGSFVLNYGTPCSIPGDPRCDWANTSASMFVTFNARTQGSSPSAAQNFRSLLGGHQVSNGGQYVGTDSWVPVSDPNNGFFGYVGSTRGIFSAILPVNASGVVSFRGDIQANASYTNHNPYPANIFSSLSVDFSNTALLAGVTAYDADGNDITADTEFEFESGTVVPKGMPTVVPEPSTYAMLSLGLLALGFARKRIT